MIRSQTGDALTKTLTVRLVPPDGHTPETKTFRAPGGKYYTPDGIERLLEHVVDWLDKHEKYGRWEWRMVRVGRRQVNFVYAGIRETTALSTVAAPPSPRVEGKA